MRWCLAVVGVLLSLSVSAQTFRPEAIRAHMSFLASDLTEGRGTGTRGYDLAAAYVAAQFEAYGLEPGVGGSSYFQPIEFRKTTPLATSTLTIRRKGQHAVTKSYGDTFTFSGNALAESSAVSGDVVFVGFGITAPELEYDDYRGIDVKGKIVAIYTGAPASFASTLRAHYSSSLSKLENAISHGAVAIVNVGTPTDYARFPWKQTLDYSTRGSLHWLRSDRTPRNVFPELPVSISFSREGIDALFAGSRQSYIDMTSAIKEGKARRGPLGVHLSVDARSSHDRVDTANVVGVVRGSDSLLRDEYIVVTSHLDHLGITTPVDGDAINNGALDNASGIAAILETSKALVERRPRRSVVFVATAAEEKGLRGADFYANNPTVPFEAIVANLNIDQIYLFAPTKDITGIGAENSDLGVSATRVAQDMGIELSADPFPEEVVFVRSDQYPFVRRGIPALFAVAGHRAADGSTDLLKLQEQWNRSRYHRPGDDMAQPLDFRPGAQMAEFAWRLLLEVGNADARPRWKAGDFFLEKFGRR